MNIRRGLFRLWVLFAAAWALAAAYLYTTTSMNPYVPTGEYIYYPASDDFKPALADFNPYMDEVAKVYRKALVSELQAALFIPRTVPDAYFDTLMERFVQQVKPARDKLIEAKRWENLWWGLITIIVTPTVVFIIGFALIWAFSGFRSPKPHPPGQS